MWKQIWIFGCLLHFAHSQQGQNLFFSSQTQDQQGGRFTPFQLTDTQNQQEDFSSIFPQTNAGPFSPFRQIASSNGFQSQQNIHIPGRQDENPRFSPLQFSSPPSPYQLPPSNTIQSQYNQDFSNTFQRHRFNENPVVDSSISFRNNQHFPRVSQSDNGNFPTSQTYFQSELPKWNNEESVSIGYRGRNAPTSQRSKIIISDPITENSFQSNRFFQSSPNFATKPPVVQGIFENSRKPVPKDDQTRKMKVVRIRPNNQALEPPIETPVQVTSRTKPKSNFKSETTEKSQNARKKENLDPENVKNFESLRNPNFEVVTMSQDHVFVSEDNFKGFVDSGSIDVSEPPAHIDERLEELVVPSVSDDKPSVKKDLFPIILKEFVNVTRKENPEDLTTTQATTTSTEGWIVVASVQTSRSVSGARFIPSSAIKQEQYPLDSKESKNITKLKTSPTTPKVPSSSYSPAIKVSSALPPVTTRAPNTSPTSTPSSSHPTTTKVTLDSSPTTSKLSKPTSYASRRNSSSKSVTTVSTESIIDKLDQVQSELSSGFLSGDIQSQGRSDLDVIPDMSTQATQTSTEKTTTMKSTTEKRKNLSENVLLEEVNGPSNGFKNRNSPKRQNVTTSEKPPKKLTKVLEKIKFEDVSALLPADYKLNSENATQKSHKDSKPKSNSRSGLKYQVKFEDVSSFLPSGYQLPSSSSSPETESKIEISSQSDLPKVILEKAKTVDLSSFLPPGYKLTTTTEIPANISEPTTEVTTSSTEATTKSNKVVFPSRPGGSKKPPSNPGKSSKSGTLRIPPPTIQKGWPTRATTEFNGWPSPSPSTISIETLLQAAKEAATRESNGENDSSSSSTTTMPSTTMTTTTTSKPTTPGICNEYCDLAGTIKLTSGVQWVPELLDHNTKEWRTLANDVEQQLEAVYQSSEALSRWYRKITVDAFSQGSVIVDYFVELSDLGKTVNTAEMKRLFHETLLQETITSENFIHNNSSNRNLKLGKYMIDSASTDFVVLPKAALPTVAMAEQDMWLPQWAIAVVVVGLASLLFVVIFGATVLINKHKNSKKHPTVLTEDMLNELNKSHMGGGYDNYGADDLYNMEDVWNEKPFKRRTSYYEDNGLSNNIYDSWRSDWNAYYGNSYYANGGSTHSGYSRRRSDYDTNF